MRILLLLLLLATGFTASAQRIDTAYHCKDGRIIQPGDTIDLGSGTLPNGDFKYITMMGVTEQAYLPSDYSGLHFTVKYFRLIGNKKMGYKTFAVFNINAFAYWGIDIEQAIKAKEIEF